MVTEQELLQELTASYQEATENKTERFLNTKDFGEYEIALLFFDSTNGRKVFWEEAYSHYLGDSSRVSCPLRTYGEPCLVCDALNNALRDGYLTQDSDLYRSLKSKVSCIWCVVPLANPAGGPKFLRLSWGAHKKMVRFSNPARYPEFALGKQSLILSKERGAKFPSYEVLPGTPTAGKFDLEEMRALAENPLKYVWRDTPADQAGAIHGTVLEKFLPSQSETKQITGFVIEAEPEPVNEEAPVAQDDDTTAGISRIPVTVDNIQEIQVATQEGTLEHCMGVLYDENAAECQSCLWNKPCSLTTVPF